MKWFRDPTGRFPQRPHWEGDELDVECEDLINRFLRERPSGVQFPISTEDLTVLLEQQTSDLDIGADLSEEGLDVQGITYFLPSDKPRVMISSDLGI